MLCGRMTETHLQMARRHVTAGQDRVDAQVIRVAEARRRGGNLWLAEEVLLTLETSQATFREDLAHLEALATLTSNNCSGQAFYSS
jgi:hypothetical protein